MLFIFTGINFYNEMKIKFVYYLLIIQELFCWCMDMCKVFKALELCKVHVKVNG